MKCYERFLKYVSFESTSNEDSLTCPSTPTQLILAEEIAKDMKEIGIKNVEISSDGYIYGEIPANTDKEIDVIGFIAHMDTSPDMSGKNINYQILYNYDGNDIILNKDKNIIMKTSDFGFLKSKVGKSLICTDGTTLLGADDKAGISEILTMAQYIINSDLEHGTIKIAFTPDEEIGRGADKFDVDKFGAKYAYTVDGGDPKDVEYENFNAASAIVTLNGVNIHPGSAKDKMLNSINLAYEFDHLLPQQSRPQHTEMYEGFVHLNNIEGNVEKTTLYYIIRDHDKNKFNNLKNTYYDIQKSMNEKYGENTVEVLIKDSYYNMADELKDKMEIIDIAKRAIKKVGLEPSSSPIRGGTDGARLTFMGLPCPNLGTGGYNYHGRYECITIEDMDICTNILIEIVKEVANK